ncbi:UNVERIFIED_CONTAM: hypothetical protein FKN15_033437 [Acipenser sinensis]
MVLVLYLQGDQGFMLLTNLLVNCKGPCPVPGNYSTMSPCEINSVSPFPAPSVVSYTAETVTHFSVFRIAAISSNCEPPGPNYALPEAWEMDDTKRKESVSIALQWINEPLAALLRGHEPADQLKADTLLRLSVSTCTPSLVLSSSISVNGGSGWLDNNSKEAIGGGDNFTLLPSDLVREAAKTLQLTVGEDLYLAINCAAHTLMDYDKQQWNKLYTAVSSKCYLLAETTSKPIRSLLVEEDLTVPGFSIVILKQTNQTTVSDMIEINRRMRGPAEKHEFPVLTEETEADPLSQA